MSFETEMNMEKELEHDINEQHGHNAQQHALFRRPIAVQSCFCQFFKKQN